MLSHLQHFLQHPVSESLFDIWSKATEKIQDASLYYYNGHPFTVALDKAWISPNNVVTFRVGLILSGFIMTYTPQQTTWVLMISIWCILDYTDGKLARDFNKKSKEGEIYDPASDKITEIVLSLSSLPNLDISQSIVQIKGIIVRCYLHYISQFNEKRWSVQQQISIFKDLILNGDKNVKYINTTTVWAANNAWKIKTTLQFTWWLGLAWLSTPVVQSVLETILRNQNSISIHQANKTLTWALIATSLSSIPFSIKSIIGRKEKGDKEGIQYKNYFFSSEYIKSLETDNVLIHLSSFVSYMVNEILKQKKWLHYQKIYV